MTFARFTATATPRPEPVESTAWPSAVADDFAFDPAWIFWVPVVSTLAVPPPLPATYASVVLLSRLNDSAPAIARLPS